MRLSTSFWIVSAATALCVPGAASSDPASPAPDRRDAPAAGFVGIGVALKPVKDGYAVIQAILPMAGADAKMGLRKGDKLTKIDGKPTRGLSTHDLLQRIRGKAGTSVVLTVARSGSPKPVTVKVVRRAFHPEK